MKYQKDDIVEWKVWGSGGPGRVLGRLRCNVTLVSECSEVYVVPVDYAIPTAHQMLVPYELEDKEFTEIVTGQGFLESNPEENLTLIYRPGILDWRAEHSPGRVMKPLLDWLIANGYPYTADSISEALVGSNTTDINKIVQETTELVTNLKRCQRILTFIKEAVDDHPGT